MSNYEIVEYFGCNDSSYPCGYCKDIKKDSDFGKFRSGKYSSHISLSLQIHVMYGQECGRTPS